MTVLKSYVVVLNFAQPGPLTVGAFIAPDAASAAALSALDIARQIGGEIPPLVNCLVVEETAEHLRSRLRAIEGKPAGEIVSMVPHQTVNRLFDNFGQRAAELLRTVPTEATPIGDQPWASGDKVTCYGEEFGPPMPYWMRRDYTP